MEAPSGERQATAGEPRREPEGRYDQAVRIQTVALAVLALVALAFTLRAAAALLVPIVIAVLLQFVLAPAVRWLRARGLPSPLSAGLLMLVLTAALGFGLVRLSDPAQEWMRELPDNLREVRVDLERVFRSMESVQKAAEEVDGLAEAVSGGEKGPGEVSVRVDGEGGLLTGAGNLAGSFLVCWFLLLFLLASQDSFLRSLVRVLPRLRDKKVAVEVVRGIELEISRYLTTITLVNLGLGVAVGIAMHLFGLPNPILWGVMAMVFNYVPYAGAIVGALVVTLVALMTLGATVPALLVPVAYMTLTGIEGMLITPAIVGRRLSLRPVVVFLGLMVWAWLWGVAGALLAIPMLVVLNILCRHVALLRPLGEFLGAHEEVGPPPARGAEDPPAEATAELPAAPAEPH